MIPRPFLCSFPSNRSITHEYGITTNGLLYHVSHGKEDSVSAPFGWQQQNSVWELQRDLPLYETDGISLSGVIIQKGTRILIRGISENGYLYICDENGKGGVIRLIRPENEPQDPYVAPGGRRLSLRRWISASSACASRCTSAPAAKPPRCKIPHCGVLRPLGRVPSDHIPKQNHPLGWFCFGAGGGTPLRRWISASSACASRCTSAPAAKPPRCKIPHCGVLRPLGRVPSDHIPKQNHPLGWFCFGAGGGTRTHTGD